MNEHECRQPSSRQPRPGGLRVAAACGQQGANPHLVVHGAPPARDTRNETPTRSGRVLPTRRRPTTCGSRGRGTPARAALSGPAAAGPAWSTTRRSTPAAPGAHGQRTVSARSARGRHMVSPRPACPLHTRTDGSCYRAPPPQQAQLSHGLIVRRTLAHYCSSWHQHRKRRVARVGWALAWARV